MQTAAEAVTEIGRLAEKCTPALRVVKRMKSGDAIRQGDIYVERLEALPSDPGKPTTNAHLAVGKTQGSRHIIDPVPAGMRIFAPVDKGPLIGPLVESPERWMLTHPEHGHFDLPAGVFRVTYQRDYARERAEEIRRVSD